MSAHETEMHWFGNLGEPLIIQWHWIFVFELSVQIWI